MKEPRDLEVDKRDALEIWRSVDTFPGNVSIWRKPQEPYDNPWEYKSHETSQESIRGRPVWPHKKYLGKTPRRWLELLLFFLIFYTLLFWITVAMYHIYMYVIKQDKIRPEYQDIILRERGISSIPPQQERNDTEPTCIKFNEKAKKAYDDFLKKYGEKKDGQDCSFNNKPSYGQYCKFDINKLGPCRSSDSKCIIIKMNRVIDWLPEPYKDSSELPSNFPKRLKVIFEATPTEERNAVWISCHGLEQVDRDNIKTVSYYPPSASIPAFYFPFGAVNQENYQDPLVGVQITTKKGGLVSIFCKSWVKNLNVGDPNDGSFTFIIKFT